MSNLRTIFSDRMTNYATVECDVARNVEGDAANDAANDAEGDVKGDAVGVSSITSFDGIAAFDFHFSNLQLTNRDVDRRDLQFCYDLDKMYDDTVEALKLQYDVDVVVPRATDGPTILKYNGTEYKLADQITRSSIIAGGSVGSATGGTTTISFDFSYKSRLDLAFLADVARNGGDADKLFDLIDAAVTYINIRNISIIMFNHILRDNEMRGAAQIKLYTTLMYIIIAQNVNTLISKKVQTILGLFIGGDMPTAVVEQIVGTPLVTDRDTLKVVVIAGDDTVDGVADDMYALRDTIEFDLDDDNAVLSDGTPLLTAKPTIDGVIHGANLEPIEMSLAEIIPDGDIRLNEIVGESTIYISLDKIIDYIETKNKRYKI